MATINKISDTKISCYAMLTLSNGDPIHIAVSGKDRHFSPLGQRVVVKKSKGGIFGKKLYVGTSNYNGRWGDFVNKCSGTEVPSECQSPALQLIVALSMNAHSAEELASTLNS